MVVRNALLKSVSLDCIGADGNVTPDPFARLAARGKARRPHSERSRLSQSFLRFVRRCFAAVGVVLAWPLVAAPGVTDEAIAFGQSAGFTGPNQRLGIEYRSGLLAAFEERNAAGGVDGRRLELIALDDAYEPASAAANAERFASENNVLAVAGGVGTPTAARIAPVLRTAGIPFIGHVTGADFLHDSKRFPNVINVRASYFDEVQFLVDHIVSDHHGGRRLGIIYQDDAFGRSVMRSYLAALAEHDIPLLAKTTYSRNTHAVHASLFGLAKADLDAVLLVGTYSANAQIINLARSLGHDYTMANLSFSLSYELRRRVEELSEQILVTEVVPSPLDQTSALAGAFRRAMATHARAEEALSEVALEGYLLGRYLVSTLERMDGDLTRAAFMAQAMPAGPVLIDDWPVAFPPGSNSGSTYVRLTHLAPDSDFGVTRSGP